MQKGHCLCGDVQYEFDETQVGFGLHCHCKDCQRVTGSGKATVILFPLDAVSISGEYKTFASLGFEGSHVNRGFCPKCGSQMFTFVDELPGQIFIKAGGMEDTSWLSV
ncbi:MAG: GFA family protein, partial [Halieaceae bacterium]